MSAGPWPISFRAHPDICLSALGKPRKNLRQDELSQFQRLASWLLGRMTL